MHVSIVTSAGAHNSHTVDHTLATQKTQWSKVKVNQIHCDCSHTQTNPSFAWSNYTAVLKYYFIQVLAFDIVEIVKLTLKILTEWMARTMRFKSGALLTEPSNLKCNKILIKPAQHPSTHCEGWTKITYQLTTAADIQQL